MKQLNKYLYQLTIALVVVFSISSCKKSFIEKLPPGSLTPEQALKTETDLQVALRGAYVGLRNTNYYGTVVPLAGDALTDNVYVSLTNTNRYTEYTNYDWTRRNTTMLNMWTNMYNNILRANNIIDADPVVVNQANIDQYKGEAYALRALNYFNLVRFFARPYTDNPSGLGVPIILTYDPALKPNRNTVAQVYTQILSDLSQAYTLMKSFTNSSQFSKYAAKALEAKVHMTMGNKAAAKTAALDVINNSGFTVVPAASYLSYWSTLTPRTDKVETLFEASSDALNNNGFEGLAGMYNQAGYGDFLLSSEFFPVVTFSSGTAAGRVVLSSTGTVESVTITSGGSGYTTAPTVTFSSPPFSGTTATGTAVVSGGVVTGITITNPGSGYSQLLSLNDVRRGLYVTVAKGGLPSIAANNKYPGINGTEISDAKILRMSEMYLIAAEASLPENETDARTYVNYIRSRRNAPDITSTGAQLYEDIIEERRRELALEGDRFHDLLRLKRDIIRSTNFPLPVRSILYSNFRRILPIPDTEINSNPNIEPNPGYQ